MTDAAPRFALARCPVCRRPLRWSEIWVDSGGDPVYPSLLETVTDRCNCGLRLSWRPMTDVARGHPAQEVLAL